MVYAAAVFVHPAKVELRAGVSLVGRLTVPADGLHVVELNAAAVCQGCGAGAAQRGPVRGAHARQLHDLAAVVGGVVNRPQQRLQDGVRLAADGDLAAQVGGGEAGEARLQTLPAGAPRGEHRLLVHHVVAKLGVAVAVRLLAVRGQEVGEPGAQVAAYVLHQHGDAVGAFVRQPAQVGGGHLLDRAFGKLARLREFAGEATQRIGAGARVGIIRFA